MQWLSEIWSSFPVSDHKSGELWGGCLYIGEKCSKIRPRLKFIVLSIIANVNLVSLYIMKF